MKLCYIVQDTQKMLGVYKEGNIININEALKKYPEKDIPKTLTKCMNEVYYQNLKTYVETLPKKETFSYKEENCQFASAVQAPEKIICVGLNYQKHADETHSPYPEVPILFSKFNNALAGHNTEINIPTTTEKLDYEAELAIVMGKTAKGISEEEALDYVFGYMPANDVSARDLQMRTPQWLLGKTNDGFAPVSPFITTKDEALNPDHLDIETTVNGEIRQKSNTSDMIFNCREIISYVSKHMTLKPGDIILTGTPEGVAMGQPEAEQVYLKDGDIVTVKVEKLGELTNRFVAE